MKHSKSTSGMVARRFSNTGTALQSPRDACHCCDMQLADSTPSPVPIIRNTAACQPSYRTWRSTCGLSQMLDQQHVGMPFRSLRPHARSQLFAVSTHNMHLLLLMLHVH